MTIAVINEVSAAQKNGDIVRALQDRGHQILNCGMTGEDTGPELNYLHTGFLAGYLLGKGLVDLVVGGCGTGQGFLNSALQYPGVACGLLRTPLDAALFARINGGNCISLALNEGYGWGGDVNLALLFDAFFASEIGSGFPEHRKEPQRASRRALNGISIACHKDWDGILASLPKDFVDHCLGFPAVRGVLDMDADGISGRTGTEGNSGGR